MKEIHKVLRLKDTFYIHLYYVGWGLINDEAPLVDGGDPQNITPPTTLQEFDAVVMKNCWQDTNISPTRFCTESKSGSHTCKVCT